MRYLSLLFVTVLSVSLNGAATVQISETSPGISSQVDAWPHVVGLFHESHRNIDTSDGISHVVVILNRSLGEHPTPQGAFSTKARPQEAANMMKAASSWESVESLFKHSLRTKQQSSKGMADVKAIFQHSLRPGLKKIREHNSAEGMADVRAIFEHSLRPEVKERLQQESSKGMADVRAIFEHSLRPEVMKKPEHSSDLDSRGHIRHYSTDYDVLLRRGELDARWHVKKIFELSLRPEVKERLQQESSKGMADVRAIFEHSLRPEVKERLQQESSKGMADVRAIFEHSLRPEVKERLQQESSKGMADVKDM